jgi:serine/threonine protein kinase
VKKEDLKFSEPPKIVGRGTFGLVLMGEYRGTQVAVKRVLPPRSKRKGGSAANITTVNSSMNESSSRGGTESAGSNNTGLLSGSNNPGLLSGSHILNPSMESGSKLGMLSESNAGLESDSSRTKHKNKKGYGRTSAIGYSPPPGGSSNNWKTAGILSSVLSLGKFTPPGRGSSSSWKRLRQEFIEEMRYMSKLRHPCVTTVMGKFLETKLVNEMSKVLVLSFFFSLGAIIAKNEEPMLVMEFMEHGSLYDILHNETMPIDGELLLPILRDIAQGMRFLHAAVPKVLHGDLKAANILVDSKVRTNDYYNHGNKQIHVDRFGLANSLSLSLSPSHALLLILSICFSSVAKLPISDCLKRRTSVGRELPFGWHRNC